MEYSLPVPYSVKISEKRNSPNKILMTNYILQISVAVSYSQTVHHEQITA
jgi:hypothetical protein